MQGNKYINNKNKNYLLQFIYKIHNFLIKNKNHKNK